jgi:hypothetical protein
MDAQEMSDLRFAWHRQRWTANVEVARKALQRLASMATEMTVTNAKTRELIEVSRDLLREPIGNGSHAERKTAPREDRAAGVLYRADFS